MQSCCWFLTKPWKRLIWVCVFFLFLFFKITCCLYQCYKKREKSMKQFKDKKKKKKCSKTQILGLPLQTLLSWLYLRITKKKKKNTDEWQCDAPTKPTRSDFEALQAILGHNGLALVAKFDKGNARFARHHANFGKARILTKQHGQHHFSALVGQILSKQQLVGRQLGNSIGFRLSDGSVGRFGATIFGSLFFFKKKKNREKKNSNKPACDVWQHVFLDRFLDSLPADKRVGCNKKNFEILHWFVLVCAQTSHLLWLQCPIWQWRNQFASLLKKQTKKNHQSC